MDEAFRIGRHGRVPVLISHHKCAGAQNWGRTRETLQLFDKVRLEQDVSCDCYPYSVSSSTLDKKQITDEFDIVITWSTPHPEVAGLSAARFNLSGRGLVREGYFADLVLFDPQTVAARATFAEQQPAAGIDTVMMNGIISYGEAGGAIGRAGCFLRRAPN